MYRLADPDKIVVKKFYKDYKKAITDGIEYYLKGGQYSKDLGCGKTKYSIKIQVSSGSTTELFLKHLKAPKQLESLIEATPEDLLAWILYVEKLFTGRKKEAFYKLTRKYHQSHYKSSMVIDHFYTIMHDIFVERVFDAKDKKNKPVFNKKKFCVNSKVSICPYCGIEDITPHKINTKTGVSYVKPDIDHFYPKSKYPFLAMSFCNLFPAGAMCNRSRKGVFDPLKSAQKNSFHLFNPYRFNAAAFTFCYDLVSANYLVEKDYAVKIDFKKNKDLEKGYSRKLGMVACYSQKRYILVDLYKQMAGLSDYYKNDLYNLGILGKTKVFELAIGHPIKDYESRRRSCYKFELDMATQLFNDSSCGWPW